MAVRAGAARLALGTAFALVTIVTAAQEPTDVVVRAQAGYTQIVTRQSPFPARTQPGGTLGLTLGVEGARHSLGLSASFLTVGQSRLDEGFAYRPYSGARYGLTFLRRVWQPGGAGATTPTREARSLAGGSGREQGAAAATPVGGPAPSSAASPLSLSAGAELSLSVVRFRDSTLYAAAPGAALVARLDLDRPETPWVWFSAASLGADWRRDVDLSLGFGVVIGVGYSLSRALRPWIESLDPPDRPPRGAPRGGTRE